MNMCNLVIIREMQPLLRRWVLASTNTLALYSFSGIGASRQQQHIVSLIADADDDVLYGVRSMGGGRVEVSLGP